MVRPPDLTLRAPDGSVYLRRWHLLPRNRWLTAYLHEFVGDDPDRIGLHDHEYLNLSMVLSKIGYSEEVFVHRPREGAMLPPTRVRRVRRWVPRFRLPTTAHRVRLARGADGAPVPCRSLFLGGPRIRGWGFWTRAGLRARWVPWREATGDDYTRGGDRRAGA